MACLARPRAVRGSRTGSHDPCAGTAIEEVYELIDAIDEPDDHEMAEELGICCASGFHCQLARAGAFDFEQVARHLVDKLIRRHPHVFGTTR